MVASIGSTSPLAGQAGSIATLRSRLASDPRVAADPSFKAWCIKRWQFLFLAEAVNDATAVAEASRPADRRPAKQRIAERFLVGAAKSAWPDEQPAPASFQIQKTTLVFCPGLLNGLLPVLEFGDSLPRIEQRFKMRVLRAASHPARSCEANVADILRAVNEGKGIDAAGKLIADGAAKPPGDLMLVGYSKGAPDILTTLARHPELRSRVRCVVSWAGAVLGSEVSDSVLAPFKGTIIEQNSETITKALRRMIPGFLKSSTGKLRRLDEYDAAGAAHSLSTSERDNFMASNKASLDGYSIPMFYLRGATTLSEVPLMQRKGFRDLCKFDPQNDMQVPCNRSILPFPMGTDLGIVHGHHWDLAFPAFVKRKWWNNLRHPFPKEAALTATIQLMAELGLIN